MNAELGRCGLIFVSTAIVILGVGGVPASTAAAPAAAISAPYGTLDHSFGQDGIVNTRLNRPIWIRGAAVQPDGKIVVVGVTNPNTSGPHRPVIIRYRTDGSLDSEFGKKGVVTLKLPNTYFAFGRAVCIQADGKIVVAGEVSTGQYNSWILTRIRANGSLDRRFGDRGIVVVDFGGFSRAFAVQIQVDGTFIVGGDNLSRWTVGRFSPEGKLDETYGIGGFATWAFTSRTSWVTDLVILPDGRAVATGYDHGFDTTYFLVARCTSQGQPDDSFGTNGQVQDVFPVCTPPGFERALSGTLALLPDGAILVGGVSVDECPSGVVSQLTVARYTGTGTLDLTYGANGVAVASVYAGTVVGLAPEPDGAVLAGAWTYGNFGPGAFNLLRFRADGQLDESFGTGGFVTTVFGDLNAEAVELLTQPDGKVVLVGTVGDGVGMVRYLTSAVPPSGVLRHDDRLATLGVRRTGSLAR